MSEIACLALLAADRVWIENNGKFGMVGIFDNFSLQKFPAQVSPFFLYVRLGKVPKGKNIVRINIIFEKTNLLISNIQVEVDVQVDLSIVQLPVPIPPLSLPSPGDYSISLIANEKRIAEYLLRANMNLVNMGNVKI